MTAALRSVSAWSPNDAYLVGVSGCGSSAGGIVPGTGMAMANSNFLSVQDILDMFDVSPRTWEKWRARRLTPTGRRLPNVDPTFTPEAAA